MEDSFATGFLAGQGNDNGNRNDDGMMGGGFIWIILLFVLFGAGGNGFGGNNKNDCATKSDLCDGFNFNDLQRSVSEVGNGICSSTYALNTALLTGFNGVGQQISDSRFAAEKCCCETNRNIDAVRYENAKNTCDIITAGHADADRIINHLTQDKIESLRDQLQSANLVLAQSAQTRTIIDTVRPCPIPAFPTCNPWGCNSGLNNGCGCGV